MKNLKTFSWVYSLLGVVLCTMLVSFSNTPGAHSFQVYLDDKLVIDQHVNLKTNAPMLRLDPADNHRQLIVKYDECGRTVTGRVLSIRDDKNRTLKDWRFDGAAKGYEQAMVCLVKDVTALKQKGNNTLKLYYSSNEFPQGQQVASVVVGGEVSALK